MLLVLWGFTPDRALTVAPGFEGFRTGFPLNDWPFSWFIGLQLRVAPGFVRFHLIVIPRLYSWFYMASQFLSIS